MSPSVEVVGAYRVDARDDLLECAFEMKYGGLRLSRAEKKRARQDVREELSGLALIEVEVRDRDESFNVGDFQQPGSNQAPYDEAFLTADGTAIASRGFTAPPLEPLRLAFFLHFFDPALPLQSSYGTVSLPALQEMPGRLVELMPYEPVD